MSKLGEILNLRNGERPTIHENGTIPVYGANGIMGYTSKSLAENDFSIIFGRVGSSGEVHLAKGKMWVSDNAIYSKSYDSQRANLTFFSYYLKFKKLAQFASKTTHPIITQTFLNNFPLKCPPLEEQQTIVEVLSCVDLAIQKTDGVIAKTERLKKGLMQQLLTEGIGHREFKDTEMGKMPKEWEVTTIDDECTLGTGGTPSRANPQYYGGKIPWVKSTEVDYCIIRETEETLTEYGLQNSNARTYPTGSLVIALYGQGITRGKCAIFGIDAAVNQACAVVQSKGRIYIPFLFYWFQKSYSWIRSLSQGANQSNLNMSIIRSLKFPLPPRLEQEKIAEILSNLDKKLGLDRDQRTRIERIKLGLMDLLLTGKVRVRVD